jgi:hypothetical protein
MPILCTRSIVALGKEREREERERKKGQKINVHTALLVINVTF